MLGRDSAAVATALDAIEHTNTQALSDMRRLLAVLRDTEADGAATSRNRRSRGSTPWSRTSAARVSRSRSSGAATRATYRRASTSRRTASSRRPSPTCSSTPARRRRGCSSSTATEDLRVTVERRRSWRLRRAVPGHGLVGIHERVAVVGGQIEVGPAAEGGFVVRARLPYSVEVS